MLDKKLITNLEREIQFLKSDISTKNEIIKRLLNNDILQNKSCNMVGGEHGNLMLLMRQVIASQRAVQVAQKTYSRIQRCEYC